MLVEKFSSSSFLPRPPSAFQQAKHRGLARSVLLGRAAIFGHQEDNDLQDSTRAGGPCGKEGHGRKEPTSQLHTCIKEKVIEITYFLEWGGGNSFGAIKLG